MSQRALWVSTSMDTRGGVSSFVRAMRETSLWRGWCVRHVATHRDGNVALRMLVFAAALPRIVALLVWWRPDVLHIHMSSYGSFLRKAVVVRLARVARVPVILHVHGSQFHEFHAASPRWLRLLIRRTLAEAATVVALGGTWRDRLLEIAPDAVVTVVPNAIRPRAAIRQPEPGDPVRVLFLGRVGTRKGAFDLLTAWAKVVSGDLPAQLVMAGDGEVDAARALVETLGVGESVRVPGWVSPEDAARLVTESQILVLPSRNEGQPMAVLEAMAAGLCVVASDCGGIPDLIDQSCGLLVPAGDAAELAATLDLALRDSELRHTLGTAALQRIHTEFHVDVVAARLAALYRKVVHD